MTTVGSGIGAKLQSGIESTYGTAATFDRSHEFISESFGCTRKSINSKALRAGAYTSLSARRVTTTRTVEGSVTMEVVTKGMGSIFRSMFGAAATPVQQGATTAYLQTHTLVDDPPTLTFQVLRPKVTGAEHYFTYEGCRCTGWEMDIKPDAALMLKVDYDGEDESDAVSAGAGAYPTGLAAFHYGQGTIKKGDSALANILSAKISAKYGFATDRYYLGGAGLKAKPVRNNFVEISGSLDVEWADETALYDVWVAGTSVDIDFEFVGAQIALPYNNYVKIALPTTFLDGDAPTVKGPDILTYSVPFTALYDGSTPAITLTYMSTDAAI